jgi:hypothetical protein
MKPKILSIFSILLACVILAQFWLMGTASVATALPRPTAVPTPKSQKTRGGIIELQVEGELVEDMLGISEAFFLPAHPGEKVVVIVTVESTPRSLLKQ